MTPRKPKTRPPRVAPSGVLTLSRTEQERFAKGILNPKPATEEVSRAIALHRKLVETK